MSALYFIVLAVCVFAWVAGVVFFLDTLRVARRRRNRMMDREAWDTLTRNWR